MSDNTKRLRDHVASYNSMSRHRENCLDVCDEVESQATEIERLATLAADRLGDILIAKAEIERLTARKWFCENCGCGRCLEVEEELEALKEQT